VRLLELTPIGLWPIGLRGHALANAVLWVGGVALMVVTLTPIVAVAALGHALVMQQQRRRAWRSAGTPAPSTGHSADNSNDELQER
jgi:hypothetical protein